VPFVIAEPYSHELPHHVVKLGQRSNTRKRAEAVARKQAVTPGMQQHLAPALRPVQQAAYAPVPTLLHRQPPAPALGPTLKPVVKSERAPARDASAAVGRCHGFRPSARRARERVSGHTAGFFVTHFRPPCSRWQRLWAICAPQHQRRRQNRILRCTESSGLHPNSQQKPRNMITRARVRPQAAKASG